MYQRIAFCLGLPLLITSAIYLIHFARGFPLFILYVTFTVFAIVADRMSQARQRFFCLALLTAYGFAGIGWGFLLNYISVDLYLLGDVMTIGLVTFLGARYLQLSSNEMNIKRKRLARYLALGALFGLITYLAVITVKMLGNLSGWLGLPKLLDSPNIMRGDLRDIIQVYGSYIYHSFKMKQFLPLVMGDRTVTLLPLIKGMPVTTILVFFENLFVWAFLYSALRRRVSYVGSLLLSSLYFVSCHIISYSPDNPIKLGFFSIFLVAISIGIVYEKTKSFWATVSLHWVCLFLMLLSGQVFYT